MNAVFISLLNLCIMSFMMSRSLAFDDFPEKFEAAEKNKDLTLTCNTNSEEPVTWKLDDYDYGEVTAKSLIIENLQEDLTGNYTCWIKGKVVDYTYVLIDSSQQPTDYHFSCTAETFNCTSSLSCRWKATDYQYFRVRNDRENSGWVRPCDKNNFQLNHSTNPFAEETEPLIVVGEAVSSTNYFKTRQSFYLRDIIKPGCPKVSLKKKMVVEVGPPDTWSMPLSYYPLEHEISIWNVLNESETRMMEGKMTLPIGSKKVRVRCRDSVLKSEWSQWTEWKNVRNRRSIKEKKQMDGKKNKKFSRAK